ncbi:MAG: glycogen/starch/alpha-glucan phosphorylase [Rhodobacterales bacterium]|nr:glycogen/starch/alpha-glucan phosphorylase [Rhodobacterales bacterium]
MDTQDTTVQRDDLLPDLSDAEAMRKALVHYMIHNVGRDPDYATRRDWFYALAYLVRGVLSERYIRSGRRLHESNAKRVYYLSMEYLIGRSLTKQLIDLGMMDTVRQVMTDLGQDYDVIETCEPDAALGNGGLGRLAACFLDSLATLALPGLGYGIRYDYGMFTQRIDHGRQVEEPETWLRHGNPWEFERPDVTYQVRFGGRMVEYANVQGKKVRRWADADEVLALAFDLPVSGYRTPTVTNLRLWSARSGEGFNLRRFNEGNYVDAVRNKTQSETLSKVLYPNDSTAFGQELRLKQEYFFVSASIQDILHRYHRKNKSLDDLPEKVAIQLNDTHPALAVPELLRLLVDVYEYSLKDAWDICARTFSYTNHTLLPEALEIWSIGMLEAVLPRHLELIYWINDQFLRQVRHAFPGDPGALRRMSLVDEDRRAVRMAYLAIVGSHKVNGVAELHTRLLRSTLFADFDGMMPDRFVNMTNGITPRRWIVQANPGLTKLVTEAIGDGWQKDLDRLRDLEPLAEDAAFRESFQAIKAENRERLARLIADRTGVTVDPSAMVDSQVKRIHEYKRQLLNLLNVITRYNRLRDNPKVDHTARTVVIAGKAAPGYDMAKRIVHLINDVADTVNNDPLVGDRLHLVFVPNYNVSAAEVIIPGSDLSEQISTAGTEASGTGNMKLALNGALTIGTLDGANIEILEEVGEDNIFIFGLDAEGARRIRTEGYDPMAWYTANKDLKRVLDMISGGFFSPTDPDRHRPVVDALLRHGDHYLLLADYAAYVKCQDEVDKVHADPKDWTRRAILNVARVGKFSSDRTIRNYADEIWGIVPLDV